MERWSPQWFVVSMTNNHFFEVRGWREYYTNKTINMKEEDKTLSKSMTNERGR